MSTTVDIPTKTKVVLGLLVLVAVTFFFGDSILGFAKSMLPEKNRAASRVHEEVQVINQDVSTVPYTVEPRSLWTGTTPMSADYTMPIEVIPWGAQKGFFAANGAAQESRDGGAITARGSLMEQALRRNRADNIRLEVKVLDDVPQMIKNAVLFAQRYAEGDMYPTEGAAAIVVMGGGGTFYTTAIAGGVERLPEENNFDIVHSFGRSYGEDQFMAPPEVLRDSRNARGLLTATVIMDDDQNIVVDWASLNGVCINPDPETYNPDCINFYATTSNSDATKAYVSERCEERPIVTVNSAGEAELTGERRTVCVDSVSVWTPEDRNVVEQRGGVVTMWSTRDNPGQMPSILLVHRGWARDNPGVIEAIIEASSEANDQVLTNSEALLEASEVTAKVLKQKDGAYWAEMHTGTEIFDSRLSQNVSVGGSQVHSLAHTLELFGVGYNVSLYKNTYERYGDVLALNYPNEYGEYVPYSEAVNTRYLEAVANRRPDLAVKLSRSYDPNAAITNVRASGDFDSIKFRSGSAELAPESIPVLDGLYQQLTSLNQSYLIEFVGHTDNTGDPAFNDGLALRRAQTIQAWFYTKDPVNFNTTRTRVAGMGQRQPVDPNANNNTAENRAKNRRVEIRIGN